MNKKQKGVFKGRLLRSKRVDLVDVGTLTAQPDERGYGYATGSTVLTADYVEFRKHLGIKLKKGEEVMVKITIETTPIKVKK